MADATAPATQAVQAAQPKRPAQDFRIAANDVDRTDIGGKFHITGNGFGDEVGAVTINSREAYVTLSNDEGHKAMWDDQNIYGILPPMSVSGEVVVTPRDGKPQRGTLVLKDRRVGGNPRADATDDKPRNANA